MPKRMIVVSDSHGDKENLRAAFEQAARYGVIDAAVFLGDGISDFESLKPWLISQRIECYAVKGNNDWSASEAYEITFTVNGVRFFACHGHTRRVKYGLDRLWFAAREHEAQVVLYGHTHRENADIEYGIQLINPGAICERSKSRVAYADIKVEDNGFAVPELVRWEN